MNDLVARLRMFAARRRNAVADGPLTDILDEAAQQVEDDGAIIALAEAYRDAVATCSGIYAAEIALFAALAARAGSARAGGADAWRAALLPFAEQRATLADLLSARSLLGLPDFPPATEAIKSLADQVGAHFDGSDPADVPGEASPEWLAGHGAIMTRNRAELPDGGVWRRMPVRCPGCGMMHGTDKGD